VQNCEISVISYHLAGNLCVMNTNIFNLISGCIHVVEKQHGSQIFGLYIGK